MLCSTARRARETLERIEPALGSPAVQIERGLYEAGSNALLDRLHAVADAVSSAMLVGHNPGLQQLALDLARPTADVSELQREAVDVARWLFRKKPRKIVRPIEKSGATA